MKFLERWTAGGRILVAGNGLAQFIGVLAAPVLTRLYSTDEFGYLAMFVSLYSILGLVASLRYDQAILAAGDDRIAAQLLGLTLVVSVAGGLLLLVPLWLFASSIGPLGGYPSEVVGFVAVLLPVGLAGIGVFQGFFSWAVRRQEYRDLAVTRVMQSLVGVLVQVVGGLAWGTYHLLLVGQVLGRAVGSGSLWRIRPEGFPRGLSWSDMWSVAGEFRRFPLLAGPATIMNSAALLLPTLLLGAAYGSTVAGWFGLGQRVVGIPMFVIGGAVANVFAAQFSALRSQGRPALRALMGRTLLRLLPFAVLVVVGSVFGPRLFALVFGEEWRTAGTFVSLLALPFGLQMLVSPVAVTANLIGRQDLQLLLDGLRIIAVVGVCALAPRLGADATTAVAWLAVVLAVTYLASLALYWLVLQGDDRS